MQRLLLLCLGAAAALRSEPHSSATLGSDIPDGVLGAAAKSLFDLVNGVKQEWKQRKAEKARDSSPVASPEPSPPLPLHEAVGESKIDFDAIKEHVENGEDVNEARDGETPLGVACRRGIPKLVQTLIELKADVNMKTGREGQEFPLGIAAEEHHLPVAKLLLAANAQVNAVDGWGHTALQYATMELDPKMVKLLKEAGAKDT
mmetsp:Transcript_41904/g.69249  ORF Transcript_41904/g.69249 Transcript_41904/m.69249 type:complete len:203 (+) Transcript_41904:58-666(+)